MNRLITFGCSLTFGHGLVDCFVPPKHPGSLPSAMGWPNIVAQHTNKICINMSSPGASNKRIWYSIINFKYQLPDIVIVLWSYPERTSIFKEACIEDIGTWNNPEYYNYMYDKIDSLIMSRLFINHANMFLQSKNIKVYNMVIAKEHTKMLTLGTTTISHMPTFIADLRELYPCAMDHCHPGIECHQSYSKAILKHLNVE